MYLREWHNDKEGSIDSLSLHEVCDETNGLDGLAQTHLIGQNTIQVIVVQRHHPFQTQQLQIQQQTSYTFQQTHSNIEVAYSLLWDVHVANLISFEIAIDHDGGLLCDFLWLAMSHVIIVDVRHLVVIIFLLRCFPVHLTQRLHNISCKHHYRPW